MINFEALFKISYGLYVVCAGDRDKGNGFISNTVFQVTAEPAKFAACCNKNNFTAEYINKYGSFSVSILQKDASSDIIGRFGYKTGKDFNKLVGMNLKYGISKTPIVLNDAIAYFECKVAQTIDVGTHWLFIGELLEAELIDGSKDSLTYQHYRDVKKGVAPKNAPTYIDKTKLEIKHTKISNSKKYKCNACGYIYDEAVETIAFANLPNNWVCPVCGSDKEDFEEIT